MKTRIMTLLSIGALAMDSHAGLDDFTLGCQTLTDKSEWIAVSSYSGNWASMALKDKRHPIVVYLERGATASLRSVEWVNGSKQEEFMFEVDWYTKDVDVVADGERVIVAWSKKNSTSTSYSVRCSVRESGVWSTPQTLYTGDINEKWDLAISNSGKPVVAIAPKLSFPNESKVLWFDLNEGSWTSTEITTLSNLTVSQLKVVFNASDVPVVCWRAYGAENVTQLARHNGMAWEVSTLPYVVGLSALFVGPTGEACLMARTSNLVPPDYIILSGEFPKETAGTTNGSVTAAVSLPDGGIATAFSASFLERDEGVWVRRSAPYPRDMLIGADGNVHMLSVWEDILTYQTLMPGLPEPLTNVSTYEEGSTVLNSVELRPDGSASVFGYVGEIREHQYTGSAWTAEAVPVSQSWIIRPVIRVDSTGKRHAYWGGYYGVEDAEGEIQYQTLPFWPYNTGSGMREAFILDDQDNPHIAIALNADTSSVTNSQGCYMYIHPFI